MNHEIGDLDLPSDEKSIPSIDNFSRGGYPTEVGHSVEQDKLWHRVKDLAEEILTEPEFKLVRLLVAANLVLGGAGLKVNSEYNKIKADPSYESPTIEFLVDFHIYRERLLRGAQDFVENPQWYLDPVTPEYVGFEDSAEVGEYNTVHVYEVGNLQDLSKAISDIEESKNIELEQSEVMHEIKITGDIDLRVAALKEVVTLPTKHLSEGHFNAETALSLPEGINLRIVGGTPSEIDSAKYKIVLPDTEFGITGLNMLSVDISNLEIERSGDDIRLVSLDVDGLLEQREDFFSSALYFTASETAHDSDFSLENVTMTNLSIAGIHEFETSAVTVKGFRNAYFDNAHIRNFYWDNIGVFGAEYARVENSTLVREGPGIRYREGNAVAFVTSSDVEFPNTVLSVENTVVQNFVKGVGIIGPEDAPGVLILDGVSFDNPLFQSYWVASANGGELYASNLNMTGLGANYFSINPHTKTLVQNSHIIINRVDESPMPVTDFDVPIEWGLTTYYNDLPFLKENVVSDSSITVLVPEGFDIGSNGEVLDKLGYNVRFVSTPRD